MTDGPPIDLTSNISALAPGIVSLRHELHSWPEPGFEEERTQEAIMSALTEVGLEGRPCAMTGVLVDIGTGEGPTIALRADIDCLRLTEQNPQLHYRSKRDGLAHACGHDGHTATLVGAARVLATVADRLPGCVRLLFQPAEEGPGGALRMIAEGALAGVSEIYGMHNWPAAPFGSLRTVAGPCLAHTATFEVKVHGGRGDRRLPHQTVDPVLVAAHIVTGLQSVVPRILPAGECAVVSITMIQGGEAANVIPETVTLTGSIQVLDDTIYHLIESRIRGVVAGTSAAHGARSSVDFLRLYPVVINTPEETEHVLTVARQMFGPQHVSADGLPFLGAEDFCYYLHRLPGCFFFLGSAEPGRNNAMCHAADFDYNDRLISVGIAFWVRLVAYRLGVDLRADPR